MSKAKRKLHTFTITVSAPVLKQTGFSDGPSWKPTRGDIKREVRSRINDLCGYVGDLDDDEIKVRKIV